MKAFFSEHPGIWSLAKVLLIVLVANLLILILRKLFLPNKKGSKSLLRKYALSMGEVLVVLLAVILAVDQFPQLSRMTSTVLGASGIIALGLSLSAQESLGNLISGLFIAIFKPFAVGDRIVLTDTKTTGTVESISLRHTVLRTYNNTRIIIPNSTMNKEKLENYNIVDSNASAFVDVTVAFESDIDLAMKLMAEIIGSHPYFIDTRSEADKLTRPKVKVFARSFADSGINLRANMWTRTVSENFEACSDVRIQLKKAFQENGIEIPYTKYVILHQDRQPEPEPAFWTEATASAGSHEDRPL